MPKFEGTTHISVVLDRSGSMEKLTEDTIGGFNTWLKATKKACRESGNETLLTMHLFDDRHEFPYVNTPIYKVAKLGKQLYFARGSTALRDAMGAELRRLNHSVKSKDRALLLVITDGYENASREFSHETLRTMITEAEEKRNWTIQYLGANQDAFAVGVDMGMLRSARVSTQASPVGTRATYDTVAMNTANFLGSSLAGAAPLTQEDYDAALAKQEQQAKTPSK